MADIITTLHPENDANINLYPNIIKNNIPSGSIDRTKLDNDVNGLLDNIGELHPSGVDTSSNILAKTSDGGIWIGSDTGKWYYWDGTHYVEGGVYQTAVNYDELSDKIDDLEDRISLIDGLTYVNLEMGYIGYTSSGLTYTPSGNRCRTPQGVYYHLKIGDIVTFNTFTNKRFLLYYELNGVYYSLGWITSAYTITIEANYYIMCSYINQATITDIDAFKDLHIVLNNSFEKEINDKVDDIYSEVTIRLNYDKFLPNGTPNTQAFSLINGLYLSNDLSDHITDLARNTDLCIHCSSNVIIGTMVYVLFYYNSVSTGENPSQLSICLCKFDITTPNVKTYIDIAKIGDSFDNTTFDKLYDCSLFNDNGILKIVFNAHLANDTRVTNYYNIYKTYDTSTDVLSNANYCIFKLGNATYNFSGSNIQLAFYNDGRQLPMYVYGQLTINPRCSLYNGYYYVGLGCVTTFNCILKTNDFITFEYVSTPSFYNISGGEEVCYVKNSKCYYYMRQKDTSGYSILSYYDLVNDKWSDPIYIPDTQSRGDLFEYDSNLYLIHSPINRDNIEIIQINETYIMKSEKINCCYLAKSFYPYTLIYNNELYMTFTNDRKHLYFSKYRIKYEPNGSVITKLKNLLIGE